MFNTFINKKIIFFFILFFIYAHKTKSQDNFESIIGTVDSEPITTYDLSQKIKIMLNSMGLVDSIENRDSLRNRAIELIIEEKVKLIESRKQQVEINDKDVDTFISDIFAFQLSEKEKFIGFLKEEEIDYDILFDQIKTELLWKKTIDKKFGSIISPNPEEVRKIMSEYEKKLGITQYNVSEIVIYKKDKEWSEVLRSIKDINDLLSQDSSFSSIASDLSEAPSSLNGGNLGWIIETQIDQSTLDILEDLKKGQYSEIIKINEGYKIIKLINKNVIGETDKKKYSFINFSSESNETGLSEIKKNITSCNQNLSDFKQSNDVTIDEINELELKDLSVEVIREIEDLKEGDITDIFSINTKKLFLIICSISGGELNTLKKEQVEQRLFQNKINIMGKTFLNKLRKQSNIVLTIK